MAIELVNIERERADTQRRREENIARIERLIRSEKDDTTRNALVWFLKRQCRVYGIHSPLTDYGEIKKNGMKLKNTVYRKR